MNRSDYLAAVGRSLDFMSDDARAEVVADMAELYDGLSQRGMDDEEVQNRIGSPSAVACEYRLAGELDRLDRSPGAAAGLRMGFATLSGRIARGAAFQLVGLVWFTLAILSVAFGVSAVAGLAVAAGVVAGFEPVATTLAVPGIPVVSGVLMGLATTAAAIALLLGNRLLMRALSRRIRRTLARRMDARERVAEHRERESPDQERSRGRWINSGRAVWQAALVCLALAAAAAVLMPAVPAREYPLVVDRSEPLPLHGATSVEIDARGVHLQLATGGTPRVRMAADLKKTVLQVIDLQVERRQSTVIVTARYLQGLDWGINPIPVVEVVLPPGHAVPTLVRVNGGDVELKELPPAVRELVRVEQGR